jgi:hypothetical protein
MMPPRPASEAPFPYGHAGGSVCYMELGPDGLRQCRTRGDLRDAVKRAQAGESEIMAVWPGQYRSDLFIIDDLAALAKAIGQAA